MKAQTANDLVEIERQWMRAIVSNDAEAIGRFMDDNWVLVTPEAGPVERQRFLSAVASGDVSHAAMEMVGDPRVRFYDGAAVLTKRVVNNGLYRSEPFTADEWSTDVFVERDGEWKCVLTHLTPIAAPPATA